MCSSDLCGAAAIALLASSAQAGIINQGEYQIGSLTVSPMFASTKAANLVNAGGGLGPVSDIFSAWHSVGVSAGDIGTAIGNDGATFTLKGKVNTDCAFYSGSSQAHTLDFGTLGIYATDNTGPALAFDMVAPATVSIYTNLAGCNTANTITVTKGSVDGLVNSANTGGYDSNVFTNKLPFKAVVNYTAADHNDVAAGSVQTLTADVNDLSDFDTHGAWKSPLALHVTIPAPSASLLAGDYSGTVSVEIAAL